MFLKWHFIRVCILLQCIWYTHTCFKVYRNMDFRPCRPVLVHWSLSITFLFSSKWKCPQISVIVFIHTLWSKVLQFKSTLVLCQVWLLPLSSHSTQQLGKVRCAFFSRNKDEHAVDELLETD